MNAEVEERQTGLVLSMCGLRIDEGSEEEYRSDPSSIKQLWAVAFAFAAQHNASIVYFKWNDPDDCLRFCVDGKWGSLCPTPPDVRQHVFNCFLDMLLGAWKSRMVRYTGFVSRLTLKSNCVVKTDTGPIVWQVCCGYNWLAFKRKSDQ